MCTGSWPKYYLIILTEGRNQDYWIRDPVESSNNVEVLAEEGTTQQSDEKTESKPPPIFISGVKNIKPLTDLLGELAEGEYIITT